MDQRVKITNENPHSLTLYVEPWGRDYTLQKGETFELVMESGSSNSHFHVFLQQTNIVVYAEGKCEDVSIYHNGNKLECGHNRELAEKKSERPSDNAEL